MTTSGQSEQVAWPVTGNIWTQRTTETDLLIGQVRVRNPSACDGAGTYPGNAYLTVFIDGDPSGSAYVGFYPGAAGRTQTWGIFFYPVAALMAPDDNLTHVMTAKVSDSCTGSGQDFTFESFKVDVISAG